MIYVSLSVAALALMFTVTSFWWQNARRGHLVASRSFTWAGYSRPNDGDCRLRFPLVLANTGPVDIVLSDLRARIEVNERAVTLRWITERLSLKPVPDDIHDFASQVIVPGRSVVKHVIEFGGHGSDEFSMDPSTRYEVSVEGLARWATGRRHPEAKWQRLVVIPIDGPPDSTRNNYIAYATADRGGREAKG